MSDCSLPHHVKWILVSETNPTFIYSLADVLGKMATPLERHAVYIDVEGEAMEINTEVC